MIKRNLIYRPSPQEILRILASGPEGRSVEWGFNVAGATLDREDEHRMVLTGRIISTVETPGMDSRLGNQQKSIERLLAHLRTHCPALLGKGKCEHIGDSGSLF